jgi:hypothetical protein
LSRAPQLVRAAYPSLYTDSYHEDDAV